MKSRHISSLKQFSCQIKWDTANVIASSVAGFLDLRLDAFRLVGAEPKLNFTRKLLSESTEGDRAIMIAALEWKKTHFREYFALILNFISIIFSY